MNDPFRPCRRGRGERVRLARGGWRPAKHIFAQAPSRRAALCASISKIQIPGSRSEGKCGARRTAPRPGRSRSQIMLIPNPVENAQIDALGQNAANSYADALQSTSYNQNAGTHRFDLFRPIPTYSDQKINPKTPKKIL